MSDKATNELYAAMAALESVIITLLRATLERGELTVEEATRTIELARAQVEARILARVVSMRIESEAAPVHEHPSSDPEPEPKFPRIVQYRRDSARRRR